MIPVKAEKCLIVTNTLTYFQKWKIHHEKFYNIGIVSILTLKQKAHLHYGQNRAKLTEF